MGDDGRFDERVAATYDDYRDAMFTAEVVEPTVDFLAALVGDGRALEFAIGTGRIAVPLKQRGVDVSGIDISRAMVARMREKPGGSDIPVVIGSFTDARVDGSFRLVYLVYNTIQNVTTQDEQVATFANAAAHLEPGGVFLVENWVPDPAEFHRNRALRVHEIGSDQVIIDVAELHPAEQRMTTTKIALTSGGVQLLPANHRYVWPAELDLMARLAGLQLEARDADWERRPFTDASSTHVTAYRAAP